MDLVIRLKRPRNADPIEALVLASKRRKKDNDQEDASAESKSAPTILKFAGTLKHQEEDISPHIFKARQREVKSLDHLKPKGVINKARSEAKRASKENRFKVVNFSRAASNVLLDHNYAGSGNDSKSSEIAHYTIVDVVHDHQTSEPKDAQVEDDGYVYSLYYADAAGGDINDAFMDSVISIEPLDMSNYPLYDYREQDDDIVPDDEDDSNDENNWRNDYPDSDPDKKRYGDDNSDESVEHMMGRFNLASERDLSTDDGEDDLPYGVDANEMQKLGRGYAHYKARVTKELEDVDDHASEIVSSNEDDDE